MTENSSYNSLEAAHLERLYGPQWSVVASFLDAVSTLTGEQLEKMAKAATPANGQQPDLSTLFSGIKGDKGGQPDFAGLLTNIGKQLGGGFMGLGASAAGMQAATAVAKKHDRVAAVTMARTVAAAFASGDTDATDIAGILGSVAKLGPAAVVGQVATALVLSDLVGEEEYTQDMHNTLLKPWTDIMEIA
ncbi:MAG: hypothetical protein ACRCSF_13980 [Mycobacteriaceae bacterium]